MNHYEAKQEARRARLEARAERLRAEGESRVNRAHEMAQAIPFGQPILVGHHSEGRDRRYRGKIEAGFRKGFEAINAAKEVAAKADSVGSGGISSDDPDAIAKLREQLAEREQEQEMMRAANAAIRKYKAEAVPHLVALGIPAGSAPKLLERDCCGRIGFPDYALSNNNANIRRIKGRIAQLEAMAKRESKNRMVGDVEVVEDAEANRLRLMFPDKPNAEMRSKLKSYGFRWAPSEGAWQRHLNNAARYAAEQVLKS